MKPTIRKHSQNVQENVHSVLQHYALRFTLPFPLFPHLSFLHTFHLLVLFTGRWKVFTLEGVYIFFLIKGNLKRSRRERRTEWKRQNLVLFVSQKKKQKQSGTSSGSVPVQYHIINASAVNAAVCIYGSFPHIYCYQVTINLSKELSCQAVVSVL